MSIDVARIVTAIARAAGPAEKPVHLHEPRFAGREWQYVKECIDTGWVSSVGSFVDRFEDDLAKICGTQSAVAVANGTAALHVALYIAGVRPGDEVVIPALTFIATANAVSYCSAIPHFVDSEAGTLGIDVPKLRAHLQRVAVARDGALTNRDTGRRIAAIVPVHVFGHPVDMDALCALAAEFNLPVVEDATDPGSTYRGKPCGGLGTLGVLSFNGNKIVTTGGGGAIVTNDPELGRRAKHLTTTAKLPHKWAFLHDEVGWNYRLPNINAALGVAQLEQLDGFVAAKRALAKRYAEAFAGMPGVRLIEEREGTFCNYWLNALVVDDDSGAARDAVLEATHAEGFKTRPVWALMHRLPMYAQCPRGDLAVAESIERRLVNLPSSAVLGMASSTSRDKAS